MSAGTPAAAAATLARVVLARLAGDAPLSGLLAGRIGAGRPKAAVLPFLAIGEARARPLGADGPAGSRASVTLTATAAPGEGARALAILARATEALEAAPLDPAPEAGSILILALREAGLADGRAATARLVVEALVEA